MSRYQYFSATQPASRPLPHGGEQSRPSAVFQVDSTTGRCRGNVFSVRDVWVPNIKGEREFSVPIRASRGKPGARRIKAQSHLPANPSQECFLQSIVFYSYLQARCTAPTPDTAHRVPHPQAGRSGRPTFPRLSINPTSKGPSWCLLPCSDAGALGQRKGLASTLEA